MYQNTIFGQIILVKLFWPELLSQKLYSCVKAEEVNWSEFAEEDRRKVNSYFERSFEACPRNFIKIIVASVS